jgi:glycine dehydrogenase subunit 1
MPYIPNTDDDRRVMLDKIGVDSFEGLLKPVPENLRLKKPLKLPPAISEMELLREIEEISRNNSSLTAIFAGGGIYDHFIPQALNNLLSRPEFVTAYTPYQAEVSQGTLQVIYEFQSCICRLTGMDVANASMYDGASAAAEAVSLSVANRRKSKVLVSETVNPLFRDVIKTYLSGREIDIETITHADGQTDSDKLKSAIDDNTACVVTAQPNFFGLLEDIEAVSEMIHKAGGHSIVVIDPMAAMLLKTPSECGADIVVGEGQPLGIPLNFGGPLLGFFAVRKDLVRSLPGRLVARTIDVEGKAGFVLTLQTREQHIRRDRATSNICTNQALCATAATIYMSLLGKSGLKKVALLSMEKTHQAVDKICSLPGYDLHFGGPYIREAAIRTPIPAKDIIERLLDKHGILPGIDMGRFYDGMDKALLLSVTEKRTADDIENLVEALGGIS